MSKRIPLRKKVANQEVKNNNKIIYGTKIDKGETRVFTLPNPFTLDIKENDKYIIIVSLSPNKINIRFF